MFVCECNFENVSFCLRKMKVSKNFNDILLISYILLIFCDLGLCVTEISHVKTEGKKNKEFKKMTSEKELNWSFHCVWLAFQLPYFII